MNNKETLFWVHIDNGLIAKSKIPGWVFNVIKKPVSQGGFYFDVNMSSDDTYSYPWNFAGGKVYETEDSAKIACEDCHKDLLSTLTF